jgi:hypothetical protein
MKRQLLASAIALAFASTAAYAEPVSLDLLLSDTQNAVSILQSESALEGAHHELERDRSRKGWQFTGSLGYGAIRNIVDDNRSISYPGAQASLGFTYPLLGASEQQKRAIDIDRGKVREKEIRLEEARHRAPLELESNYARYWGAQEAMVVLDAYLATEPTVSSRLRMRAQKKLMLESKMNELLSGYASGRNDRAQLVRVLDQTRSRLTLLTGRPLAEFSARSVSLPKLADSADKDAFLRHPDVVALGAQSDSLKAQLSNSGFYGMDAGLSVMAAANNDQRDHQTGGTAFVGVNFNAPISMFSVRREERRRLQSEINSVDLQKRERAEELRVDANAALGRLAQANDSMEIAGQKTQAAAAAVRERQLRSSVFSDEGIEAMSQQLRDYTVQALSDIDSRVQVWQANIEARAYLQTSDDSVTVPKTADSTLGAQLAEPLSAIASKMQGSNGNSGGSDTHSKPGTESGTADTALPPAKSVVFLGPAPKAINATFNPSSIEYSAPQPSGFQKVALRPAAMLSSVPPSKPAADMAVYVWNSKELIESSQFKLTFWNLLDHLSIQHLLLSLNAEQIRAAQTQPKALQDFLDNASSKGVSVELLLGEPSWIEEKNRPNLIKLIDSLHGFSFAGLHLDIEPDQIYKQPLTRDQFDNWVMTMQAAAKASPWPTSVSVHPRYLRDAPYHDWKLAQRLHDGGVREIALMIFNSDPNKVAAIARPILAETPAMHFRVAQSVEPQLDSTLSHAKRRPEEFEAAMRDLQKQLSTQANSEGVIVQAWADLMRMGYESQIH